MANTLKFGNGQWATKVGSTLAYNDEGGNFKPLPFNFTRSTSATRVNKDGLIEVVTNNKPRIDFLNDSNGALKLEPSRSNLFTYSEDFSASIWGLGGSATREANAAISPDGTLNAYKITSNGGSIGYGQGGVVSQNSTYEISFFAKKGTDNIIQITESFYFGSSTIFDLESGSITSGNGTIESYPNDWYRCSVSYTYGAGQTILSFNLKNTGLGYFYLFGFQGEQGSYATSYIPTQGAISTRVAEVCNGAGNAQVFNDSEGVLFAEISGLAETNLFEAISVNDNSLSDRIFIGYFSDDLYITVVDGGQAKYDVNTPINIKQNNKIAVKYKAQDFSFYLNGFEINSSSGINGGTTPSGLANLSFDRGDGVENFYGNTKEIAYYDEILTDLELEYMTSYRSLNEMVTELNLNAL